MRDQLLLLAAPSRESRDKADAFAAAARRLSLTPRIVVADRPERIGDPGPGMRFALACSDALAPAAARLNARHDTGGFAPETIALLGDKSLGVPYVSRLLGLMPLPQLVPRTPDDIRAWRYRGPVIAKPTRASGAWSPEPWGYRCFADGAALLDWLHREDLTARFFAAQRAPGPLGPIMLQQALDGSRSEGAGLLLTGSQAVVFGSCEAVFEPDEDGGACRRWRRAVYHPAAARLLRRRLPRLKRQRWGRGLLHLQLLRGRRGRRHLTDINLRLSTGWSWMADAALPQAHYRLLCALLFDRPLVFDTPPAPAIAIDLVHEAVIAPAAQGFDKAGAAPSFITFGDSAADCVARADAFRAGIAPAHDREIAA